MHGTRDNKFVIYRYRIICFDAIRLDYVVINFYLTNNSVKFINAP